MLASLVELLEADMVGEVCAERLQKVAVLGLTHAGQDLAAAEDQAVGRLI